MKVLSENKLIVGIVWGLLYIVQMYGLFFLSSLITHDEWYLVATVILWTMMLMAQFVYITVLISCYLMDNL